MYPYNLIAVNVQRCQTSFIYDKYRIYTSWSSQKQMIVPHMSVNQIEHVHIQITHKHHVP